MVEFTDGRFFMFFFFLYLYLPRLNPDLLQSEFYVFPRSLSVKVVLKTFIIICVNNEHEYPLYEFYTQIMIDKNFKFRYVTIIVF